MQSNDTPQPMFSFALPTPSPGWQLPSPEVGDHPAVGHLRHRAQKINLWPPFRSFVRSARTIHNANTHNDPDWHEWTNPPTKCCGRWECSEISCIAAISDTPIHCQKSHRLTMLERAIAKGDSVCSSVRPSVHHTRDPRLNGSNYRDTFCTLWQGDVCSFLVWNFVILSLAVHPEQKG